MFVMLREAMITTCQKNPLEEDENSTSIVAMGIELYQKRSSQKHKAMARKESISLQHHRQYFALLLDFIFVVVSIVIGAIIMMAGDSRTHGVLSAEYEQCKSKLILKSLE